MKLYFEDKNRIIRKSMVEGLIQILNESPMSDEDRADSDLLRSVLFKIKKRPNSARLNKNEQEVLDKYGLSVYDGAIFGSDGHILMRPNQYSWDDPSNISDKANVADMIRKSPERDYAKNSALTYSGDHNLYGKNTSDIKGRDIEKKLDLDRISRYPKDRENQVDRYRKKYLDKKIDKE